MQWAGSSDDLSLYGRHFRDKVNHGPWSWPQQPCSGFIPGCQARLSTCTARGNDSRIRIRKLCPSPGSQLTGSGSSRKPGPSPCLRLRTSPPRVNGSSARLPHGKRPARSVRSLAPQPAGSSALPAPRGFPTLENSLDDYLGVFFKSAPFT